MVWVKKRESVIFWLKLKCFNCKEVVIFGYYGLCYFVRFVVINEELFCLLINILFGLVVIICIIRRLLKELVEDLFECGVFVW